MDTSETYVKMCDCSEVQGLEREYDIHNYFGERILPGVRTYEGGKVVECPGPWLPRQDQIQEMAGVKSARGFEFATYQMYFESDGYHHCNIDPKWRMAIDDNATPEQLWLAFYMHEKHGLTWNGDKWKVIE